MGTEPEIGERTTRMQRLNTRTEPMFARIIQDLAFLGVDTQDNFLLRFLGDFGDLSSVLKEQRNGWDAVWKGVGFGISGCGHSGTE